MKRTARRAAWALGALAFTLLSWLAFRGYLTTDMMVYFVTLRWCS